MKRTTSALLEVDNLVELIRNQRGAADERPIDVCHHYTRHKLTHSYPHLHTHQLPRKLSRHAQQQYSNGARAPHHTGA